MTALLLFAVGVLVFVNGFFVAAEFALVRSRRARLEELADDGRAGARLALRQIDEISKYARKIGADLIVMGTHGHRGVRRLVMGSDAEQVVRTAQVPVLLVRG